MPIHHLSPHFTIEEFCRSDKAVELNVVNKLPESMLADAEWLCSELLEPIRARWRGPDERSKSWRAELNDQL